VHADQPSGRQPVVDLPFSPPTRHQLGARDESSLRFDELSHVAEGWIHAADSSGGH
jgi:hypothetical protein